MSLIELTLLSGETAEVEADDVSNVSAIPTAIVPDPRSGIPEGNYSSWVDVAGNRYAVIGSTAAIDAIVAAGLTPPAGGGDAGAYSPTVSVVAGGLTGVSLYGAAAWQWTRVDGRVTVIGMLECTASGLSAFNRISITLPSSSDGNASGVCNASSQPGSPADSSITNAPGVVKDDGTGTVTAYFSTTACNGPPSTFRVAVVFAYLESVQ